MSAERHLQRRPAGPAVGIHAMTVRYRNGSGVTGLDFQIRRGEVFAVLGPNGSGKSTLLQTVLGTMRPTAGSITVFGADPATDTEDLRGRTGSLVEDLEPSRGLTGRDLLSLCAAVRGCDLGRAQYAADRLGLDLDRPMAELSAGALRILGIVQALMHDPDLVILDEPAAGLDPDTRRALFMLLRDVAARGGTVLLSGHDVDDVATVADRAALLRPCLPAMVVTLTARGVLAAGYDTVLVA